jgi:hypothetical protein
VAAQVALTYWQATVLPLPHVAAQLCAFWQDAVQPSPA